MKKILCLLTAMLLCFTLCLPAYGVIAADESEGIRVTVSKKGGAPVYKYLDETDKDGRFVVYYTPTDKKIPEKSGFTVDWETAFVLDNDGNKFIEGEYDGEWVYLHPSDVSLDLSPVTPPEDKAVRTRHLTVYDDDVTHLVFSLEYDEQTGDDREAIHDHDGPADLDLEVLLQEAVGVR